MRPKATVTPSVIHTKRLARSAQSRVPATIATRMSAPPIVGVPAFDRWLCGPSERTR